MTTNKDQRLTDSKPIHIGTQHTMMHTRKHLLLHTRNDAHLTITTTTKNCTPTHTTPTHPVIRTHASARVHNLYTELAGVENLIQKYCRNIIKGKSVFIQRFIRRFLKNIVNKQKREEFLYNVNWGDIC